MTIKKQINSAFIALLVVFITACGGGDSDGIVGTGLADGNDKIKPFTITGAAQKGPYVKDTRVLINRLTATADGTSETTLGSITDDLGNFSFTFKAVGPILIEADGKHYNEITGELSATGDLRLRAIYNVNANPEQHAYINVLTHLAYSKIKKLAKSGVPIVEAIKQGEITVIHSFEAILPVANVVDFTELSLFNSEASRAISNGYLLALSATVSQYAMEKQKENRLSPVETELTYLLDNLSYSIADTGTLGSPALVAELQHASRQVRPDQVKANLLKLSKHATNTELPVANMDLFIDTDGDGFVNSVDDDDDGDGIIDSLDPSPYSASP